MKTSKTLADNPEGRPNRQPSIRQNTLINHILNSIATVIFSAWLVRGLLANPLQPVLLNRWFVSLVTTVMLAGVIVSKLISQLVREESQEVGTSGTIVLIFASCVYAAFLPLDYFPSTAARLWFLFLAYNLCSLKTFSLTTATLLLLRYMSYFFMDNIDGLPVALSISALFLFIYKQRTENLETILRAYRTELDQAVWAATRFANLNIDYQNNLRVWHERVLSTERKRIAHEIHDTVGYSLTSVLYKLNSLKRECNGKNSNLRKGLEETTKIVTEAMSDVRKEVYRLQDADLIDFSWPVRWRRACGTFSELTGIRIRVKIPKSLPEIPDTLGEGVMKIIQESLTNSTLHGRANYIDVSFKYRESNQLFLMRISDNGIGATEVSAGVGLRGIMKRAQEVGGQVAYTTEPGRGFDLGFEVELK